MSTHSLAYLAHLVMTKNAINRKRRRFWHIMHPGTTSIKLRDDDPRSIKYKEEYGKKYSFLMDFPVQHTYPKVMHPAYSLMEAKASYKKAGKQMRSMTKHMRKVRTELGAKFTWDANWRISEIRLENRTYEASEFEQLAAAFILEQAITKS